MSKVTADVRFCTSRKRKPNPVFVTVTCPKCGKVWDKAISEDIYHDEAALRLISKPTFCSRECRRLSWNEHYPSLKELREKYSVEEDLNGP